MEYTYADVIIDPEDPRVEIGKEYYFGNNPSCLLRSISQLSASEGTLVMKDSAIESQSSPFMSSENEWFVCLIRKKEMTYTERQAEWVKANNIKVGDKVKVIRKCETEENGWGCTWNIHVMDSAVDKVFKIVNSHYQKGILLRIGIDDCWFDCWFPYFVLEKVEEPEFKVGDFVKLPCGSVGVVVESNNNVLITVRENGLALRDIEPYKLEHIKAHLEPFDLKDKNIREVLLGERITHYRLNDGLMERQIVGFDVNSEQYLILGDSRIEPEVALSHEWTFMDGSPCGIVVEDE